MESARIVPFGYCVAAVWNTTIGKSTDSAFRAQFTAGTVNFEKGACLYLRQQMLA